MPKKKNPETQQEQSERFKKAVQDMIDAGELNPIEADKAFSRLVQRSSVLKSNSKGCP
jgi:polyhydroxyalkanoate synthesis regulator phasin